MQDCAYRGRALQVHAAVGVDTIVRLAGPLPPPDRDVYPREVAAALDGREVAFSAV